MEQPFHYRNKAQFPVGKSKDGRIITGFYAGRTHSIIENRDCALGVTQNKEVLDRVIAHMEKFNIQPYDENTGKGLVRHVLIRYGFFTDEMMVCLIINGGEASWRRGSGEISLSDSGDCQCDGKCNKKRNNVILWGNVAALGTAIHYRQDRRDFLSDFAAVLFPGKILTRQGVFMEKHWNMHSFPEMRLCGISYCGIGTISLFLAQKAKMVRGVEIIPAAIENAKENACLNGFANTEFLWEKQRKCFQSSLPALVSVLT